MQCANLYLHREKFVADTHTSKARQVPSIPKLGRWFPAMFFEIFWRATQISVEQDIFCLSLPQPFSSKGGSWSASCGRPVSPRSHASAAKQVVALLLLPSNKHPTLGICLDSFFGIISFHHLPVTLSTPPQQIGPRPYQSCNLHKLLPNMSRNLISCCSLSPQPQKPLFLEANSLAAMSLHAPET